MNGITSSGAKGINALGQRYMGKYHPLMEIGPRYLLIQGTHRELTEGNGPPFALDVAPMLVLFAIVMTFCILGCFLPSMPLLLICVLAATPLPKRLFDALKNRFVTMRYAQVLLIAGAFLVITAYLVDSTFSPFLYYRF